MDRCPARQASMVRAFAARAGNLLAMTCFSAFATFSTDLGTTATPTPAQTQAMIAWYEPNSITWLGTTLSLPSHSSRRRGIRPPGAESDPGAPANVARRAHRAARLRRDDDELLVERMLHF